MSCCTLGARPDIEVITRAMLPGDQGGEGLTVRAVAERFGCTRFAVEKHWRCLKTKGHVPNPAPAAPPYREFTQPESERRPLARQPDSADQTAPDSGQTRPDKIAPQTAARDAQPAEPTTWRDRIWEIADLIADDKFDGRKTISLLVQKYEVSREQIINDVRMASLLVSKDRGELVTRREVSIAKLETIRQAALEREKCIPCPHCEKPVNIAAPDLKSAVAAQKHMDEIAGVLIKQAPSVQITVNPAFGQLWGAMSKMLEAEHPEAYAACDRLLARFDAALKRRETIDVVAEEPAMLEAG